MRHADKKALYDKSPAGQSNQTPARETVVTPIASKPAPKTQIGPSPMVGNKQSTN
jgi:hypothetical protein